jgi:Tfp pilus assembly PilM family ATPase
MWSPFVRTTPIAIDLGSGALRAVQLERTDGHVIVRRWARHVLPPGVGTEGQSSGERYRLPDVSLGGQAGFAGNEMVVSLGPPEVECCPLRVPESLLNLDRDGLLAALRHEVAGQLSSPIEAVDLDFWRLVPSETDGPNLMVAAAASSAVRQVIDWATSQKLVCRRIDLSPLAALRACAAIAATTPGDCITGVLDIGRRAARLYIGIGETPIYIRRMQRGGDTMTERIAAELEVSPPVAERYKHRYGIGGPQTGYRPLAAADGAVDEHRMRAILQSVLQPLIHGLCEEIKSSFHYAMEFHPGRSVGGLMLIGGGGNLAGLAERLKELLGIEVSRPSGAALPEALAPLSALPDEALTEMIVPIGLGLAEINQ